MWLSKIGKSSSQKDYLSFFCQEWRKGSKGTSYVIISITLKFLGFLKGGRAIVPGVIKDLEWMREVLIALECPGYMPLTARCGSLTYKRWRVSWFLAAEGNEGDAIDKCDSRCSQVPWIDVRVVSSGLSHPPSICTTVLVHRATFITVQAFYVKSCV